MQIVIDIPKEFEDEYKIDRFGDSLERLMIDAHSLAGNYEKEVANMLINAFSISEVLPKGHGRLIDAYAVIAEATEGMKYPSNHKYMECVIAHMNLAPTIIEADTIRDCKTCGHSNDGKCAGTEECHECMWVNNYIESDIRALEEVKEEYIEQLIKKDTPLPVYLQGDGYADGELVYDTAICQNCNADYEVNYEHYKFCPNCGQRLDWSGIEE